MSLESGSRLGPYRIDGKIGQGGMGVVYEATDTRLGRSVAVKVLPPEVSADATRRARFEKEARLSAVLSHPNIATIHDVGETNGVFYIVMERVDGESLRRRIDRAPLSVSEVVALGVQIADGLAHAHAAGVLHRDLKPDNIVLTAGGRPKILDFGLGKLVATPAGDLDLSQAATVAADVTRQGQIVGTLSYMAPEQLESGAADRRSDLYALGVVLYEMLAGKHPFTGTSDLSAVTSILRDPPPPIGAARSGVPTAVESVVRRCLEKKPDDRYRSAGALRDALAATRPPASDTAVTLGRLLRRPLVVLPALLLLAAGVTVVGWLGLRAVRTDRVRGEVIPEIERLSSIGDNDAAARLLAEAQAVLPDDPRLEQLYIDATWPVDVIESEPTGAEIFIKAYTAPEREWRRLGVTPVENVRLPIGALRYRLTRDGYEPFEGSGNTAIRMSFPLVPAGTAPPGEVRVPAGEVSFGPVGPVPLDAFWIDRNEATNADYKAFLDAGGYRDTRWWPDTVADENGRDLSREELLARLVDSTGRPGPAGWELGGFPDGEDDLPVGGVSWYEARAYAVWAGKSLPTVFHWRRAAAPSLYSDILLLSNFGGDGPVPVGSSGGLGAFGTQDMAGNVREWCLNSGGDVRYIAGGGWSDPSYSFTDTAALHPLDRSPLNGFRCMRTDRPPAPEARARIDNPVVDFAGAEPVDDAVFDVLRRLYDYDPADLDARVENVDSSRPYWRHEVVSIRAAYGDERLPLNLFIPNNAAPPYQAVIFVPGGDAWQLDSSRNLRLTFAGFLPRTGRVLVYPIYKGTYDRRVEDAGINTWRDTLVQAVKDIRRAIDYLETRDDIDPDRIGFYGLSVGANYGPIFTAVEPRFAASVLLAGGLSPHRLAWPPEIRPLNFLPRSTVPVLMINGRDDFTLPLATAVRPTFDFHGATADSKRLVLFEGGHIPKDVNLIVRETLSWFDRWLGPVNPAGPPSGQR